MLEESVMCGWVFFGGLGVGCWKMAVLAFLGNLFYLCLIDFGYLVWL